MWSSQPSTTIVVFENPFRASLNPPDTKPPPSNPRKHSCCLAHSRACHASSQTCVCPGWTGRNCSDGFDGNGVRLPVILITAHDDDDIRQQALQDGAVAFLVKPFDGGDLLEHVARATNEP